MRHSKIIEDLAGQSNMEGKAPNSLFSHQATDPKTKDLFAHLRKDGQWIVRDDVFIKFLDRHGPLTLVFGSPDRTGMELEFGTMMGNHFSEPVLRIKAAWGGHALYKQFRSPSAELPADEVLQKELRQAQERVQKDNEKNKKNTPLPTLADIQMGYGGNGTVDSSNASQPKELASIFAEHARMLFRRK